MDDLEFRRLLYADPRDRSEQLRQAKQDSNQNARFFDELQQFERKLKRAVDVPVPQGLNDRLILRQSFACDKRRQQRKTRVHLALAASLAFALGLNLHRLSPTFFTSQPNLGQVALEHIHHKSPFLEGYDEQPSLAVVNAKMARYGTRLSQLPGKVVYVNHCNYHNSPALHMVMQAPEGFFNIFVVPSTLELDNPVYFADKGLHGQIAELDHARLVVVAPMGEPVDEVLNNIKGQLNQAI